MQKRHDWISERLKEIGRRKADLAADLGVQPPRITNLIDGSRRIQVDEIPKLAVGLEMSVASVFSKFLDDNSSRQSAFHEIDYISVKGIVAAGHWRETTEMPDADHYPIAIPRKDGNAKGLFGLEVKGTSMNRKFVEGDILVCSPIGDFPADLRTGHYVIVERRNFSGAIEATCKQLEIVGPGHFILWPRSTNPEHQQPIEIHNTNSPGMDQDGNVRVLAVVTQSLQSVDPAPL